MILTQWWWDENDHDRNGDSKMIMNLTPLRMLMASLLNQTGKRTSSWRIDSNKSSSFSASNGGC